jgi:hypothetical protein
MLDAEEAVHDVESGTVTGKKKRRVEYDCSLVNV